MVGKVRKNKSELPPVRLLLLSSRRRCVFSSEFAFTPTTALVSYVPKKNKNVLLMSTKHTAAAEVCESRRDRKLTIILDYNCNKGGVDNLDKVIGTYSCRRMMARWPLVVFYNMIDVSSYNAFVIWRETHPEWLPQKLNKRRVFMEQLGKALVTPLIERRTRLRLLSETFGPRPKLAIGDDSVGAPVPLVRGEKMMPPTPKFKLPLP